MLQSQVIITIKSSEDGIKTPSLGQTIGESWKKPFCRKNILLKKNIKSKFKEKMWCDKELEEKRKLRYYKDVINPPQMGCHANMGR